MRKATSSSSLFGLSRQELHVPFHEARHGELEDLMTVKSAPKSVVDSRDCRGALPVLLTASTLEKHPTGRSP
jgi:hypothetical protein